MIPSLSHPFSARSAGNNSALVNNNSGDQQ
jgi:hypothetical protein